MPPLPAIANPPVLAIFTPIILRHEITRLFPQSLADQRRHGNLIFYFIGHPTDDSSMTFWGYMIVVCFYTLLYSSVSFLFFWAALAWLTQRQLPRDRQRWIVTSVGVILTVLPFPVLFGRNHPDWMMMAEVTSCYVVSVVAGTWLFKFPI